MVNLIYLPMPLGDFWMLSEVISRGEVTEATPRFDREVERVAGYPRFADSDGGECD